MEAQRLQFTEVRKDDRRENVVIEPGKSKTNEDIVVKQPKPSTSTQEKRQKKKVVKHQKRQIYSNDKDDDDPISSPSPYNITREKEMRDLAAWNCDYTH
uniref:Uncharacterized protein n=1 Tax=Timema cristinae TaxID=61476 RepID=A0A7R9CEN1_TIMCR|nr:unnamed protein product [Timema cristinae]